MKFEKRYFLFDFARGRTLHKPETELLFQVLQKAGYNGIALHLEGFFELTNYSGLPRTGALSQQDAIWFSDLAKQYDFELIPVINLVGHAESFLYYQERFSDMARDNQCRQFDLYNEGLKAFAYQVIDDVIALFNPYYLHIGGDETALTEPEKVLYASFLNDLCQYVSSKGVNPCVWGDMLYEHQNIAQQFTKQVTVFDWYYNGHRKESLAFFKELGFKELFACPSDNGWDGFIGEQHHITWGEPHKPQQVLACDEIEAFLEDGARLGIQNGLVTSWENSNGHNLWSNMNAFVRAGLFMCGKDFSKTNIENCLFGRVTPYSDIAYALQTVQNEIYKAIARHKHESCIRFRMSDAVFNNDKFYALICISPAIYDEIKGITASKLKMCAEALDAWEPQGEPETLCKISMQATYQYAEVIFAIIKLGAQGYTAYHTAALSQFTDAVKATECIHQAVTYVTNVYNTAGAFYTAQANYLAQSGQSDFDLVRLSAFLKGIQELHKTLESLTAEPLILPSFRLIMDNLPDFQVKKGVR